MALAILGVDRLPPENDMFAGHEEPIILPHVIGGHFGGAGRDSHIDGFAADCECEIDGWKSKMLDMEVVLSGIVKRMSRSALKALSLR